MKLKPNYFVIPLITIAVALIGSYFSSGGMEWYNSEVIKPALTPPKIAFPIAWNLIFILTTISVLIIWNSQKKNTKFLHIFTKKSDKIRYDWIIILFAANAILNVLWSYLFFTLHLIQLALIEMMLLEATILLLIFFIYRYSRIATILLLPYALWVAFATGLTWQIMTLNV